MIKQFKLVKSITSNDDEVLNLYLKDISKIPMITQEEEIELSNKIQNGDMNARNKLVSANLRFVVSVAKQYKNMGIPLLDLINSGNAGLIEAASRYVPGHNCKFISYAVWWIRQAITDSLFTESRTIRVPNSQTYLLNKISKASEEFEKLNERIPSLEELSSILNISKKKINEIINSNLSCTSIDSTITNDDGDSGTLTDIIPNTNIHSTDYLFNDKDEFTNLESLLHKFSPREQDILRMFYGLEGVQPLPYNEIGKRFGLTGERIRQINNQIIEEIKNNYADLAKELL